MRLKLLLVFLGAAFLVLTGFAPGKLPFNPGARYSDAVTSHWGAALFLQEAVAQRQEFPIWREAIMAGAPFAANPLNKTAYPPQWFALILPPVLHLDVMILLHLLIAGAGMWRWTRALGLRPEAVALSALAYMLAPRVVGHTGAGHLDLVYALAWLPWLMAAVRQFAHHHPSTPDPASHANGEKGNNQSWILSFRSVLQIALFAALVFLADVRLSLFAFMLAGAYALYGIVSARDWQRMAWAVPALLLFLLMTASVTVPLLGWSPYLSRAGLTQEEAGVFSLQSAQLIGVVLPPQSGNIETLTYAGLPVLVLALIALAVRPRKHAFWIAALIVAAWFALGSSGLLWALLTRLIPALLWFRVPSRSWFVVALVLPLLAGFGLDWLLERTRRRVPPRWRLYALVGLAAALACGVFVIVGLPLPDAMGWNVLVGGAGLALIFLLLFTGALNAQRAAVLILIIVFADLLIIGRSWLEWRGEDDWLLPYQPLAQVLIEDDAARIYSPTYSLPQQAAEAYDLHLFGGVDPFQLEGVVDAVAQAGGVKRTGYSVVVPPLNDIEGNDPALANMSAVPDTELLAAWDVSHVVAAYPLEHARLERLTEVGGVYVYRNRDFASLQTGATLPRWQAATPNLPSVETVASLNQLTIAAAVLAAVSFGVSLLVLIRITRS